MLEKRLLKKGAVKGRRTCMRQRNIVDQYDNSGSSVTAENGSLLDSMLEKGFRGKVAVKSRRILCSRRDIVDKYRSNRKAGTSDCRKGKSARWSVRERTPREGRGGRQAYSICACSTHKGLDEMLQDVDIAKSFVANDACCMNCTAPARALEIRDPLVLWSSSPGMVSSGRTTAKSEYNVYECLEE